MSNLEDIEENIVRVKTCIEAHETLVNVDEGNGEKFLLVLTMLKDDLKKLKDERKKLCCVWKFFCEYGEGNKTITHYSSSCGHSHSFGIDDEGFKVCPYCNKPTRNG